MPLDLRPLTLAELLDRSFSTYKRHLWLFVGIMAVPAAFAMVMTVGLRLLNTPPPVNMPPDEVLRYVLPLLIGTLVFFLVYMFVYTLALGATATAVSELYLDRETTIKNAYDRVRRKAGRLTLLCIWVFLRMSAAMAGLVGVLVLVGVLLAFINSILPVLVFPFAFICPLLLMIWMGVRYGVSVPVIVVEDVTAGTALRRSVELTKGNLGRVFLVMLCAAIIAYATAAIFQGPFVLASLLTGPGTPLSLMLSLLGAVVGAIGGMFSGPLMIIGLAMMYYDLRIRKEALDLHLLLENLDAPRPV